MAVIEPSGPNADHGPQRVTAGAAHTRANGLNRSRGSLSPLLERCAHVQGLESADAEAARAGTATTASVQVRVRVGSSREDVIRSANREPMARDASDHGDPGSVR
jgi:hypothetical protein